jgi:hypothetical protein
VADRAPGRSGPGDLDGRPAGPTRAQDPVPTPDGYKAHIVVEPDTGIITDTALFPAAGAEHSDASVGVDLLLSAEPRPERPERGERPGRGERWEILADSAYGTGDALAMIARAGHTPIIKPWPLRPAVEGGFTLDDFTVTEPDGDRSGR